MPALSPTVPRMLIHPAYDPVAIAIVPLVGLTVSRAARERFDAHKAIARWTLPLWLYVSVTGVVIYLLLYQIFPQAK